MDERRRSTRGTVTRKAKEGARRRIEKSDGRLADYSALKAATGIAIPEVKRVLLDRQKIDKENLDRRRHIMYPSEMCKNDWCPRATYFRMTGVEERSSKPSMTLESIFAEGHAIHDKWQGWLSDTGKMWGDWRCTRCGEYVQNSIKPGLFYSGGCIGIEKVDLDNTEIIVLEFPHNWVYKEVTLKTTSLPISGHADGALIDHNVLIEIKSISLGGFRYEAPKIIANNTHDIRGRAVVDLDRVWRDFHHPLGAHLRQGNLYLWMCKEMGFPFDRISFVYEFKSNQDCKEFIVPYSTDIVEPILEKAHIVVDHLALGTPPKCVSEEGSCSQCRPYIKEE